MVNNRDVSGRQFEVQNDAIERDQQMQAIAKDELFLRGDTAKAGPMGLPVGCGTRHEMKCDYRYRQAIDDTVGVPRDL